MHLIPEFLRWVSDVFVKTWEKITKVDTPKLYKFTIVAKICMKFLTGFIGTGQTNKSGYKVYSNWINSLIGHKDG